jgi:hypothetical protein
MGLIKPSWFSSDWPPDTANVAAARQHGCLHYKQGRPKVWSSEGVGLPAVRTRYEKTLRTRYLHCALTSGGPLNSFGEPGILAHRVVNKTLFCTGYA